MNCRNLWFLSYERQQQKRERDIMMTVASDVADLANGATESASQRRGLFMRILRALHETRVREARRVFGTYAHLLPEGTKLTDVVSSIVADQVECGDARERDVSATTVSWPSTTRRTLTKINEQSARGQLQHTPAVSELRNPHLICRRYRFGGMNHDAY
jgi:hypothetical protein